MFGWKHPIIGSGATLLSSIVHNPYKTKNNEKCGVD
jgi:hypothetical protein